MIIKALGAAAIVTLLVGGCQTREERIQAASLADDATCREYGAAPGSDVYVHCRMLQSQRRDVARAERNRQADAGVAAGLALATGGQSAPRFQTTCTRSPMGMFTTCN